MQLVYVDLPRRAMTETGCPDGVGDTIPVLILSRETLRQIAAGHPIIFEGDDGDGPTLVVLLEGYCPVDTRHRLNAAAAHLRGDVLRRLAMHRASPFRH